MLYRTEMKILLLWWVSGWRSLSIILTNDHVLSPWCSVSCRALFCMLSHQSITNHKSIEHDHDCLSLPLPNELTCLSSLFWLRNCLCLCLDTTHLSGSVDHVSRVCCSVTKRRKLLRVTISPRSFVRGGVLVWLVHLVVTWMGWCRFCLFCSWTYVFGGEDHKSLHSSCGPCVMAHSTVVLRVIQRPRLLKVKCASNAIFCDWYVLANERGD